MFGLLGYRGAQRPGDARDQWCRRRGCKRTPKSFDLSKIRAKSLKIWEESLKNRQNLWKLHAKMATNVVWLQKMATNICRKINVGLLFWRSHQKRSSWSLWEKICRQKSHNNFFGQVWGNSGKNPRTPKNLLAPTPMAGAVDPFAYPLCTSLLGSFVSWYKNETNSRAVSRQQLTTVEMTVLCFNKQKQRVGCQSCRR